MKKTLPPEIERGRIREGEYGTDANPGPSGAFMVVCPLTKCTITIIAGAGDIWQKEGLPLPAWDHVSVSLEHRCPSWKEMKWVKEQFFEDDECVVQFFPPKSDYINKHEYVLHMWRLHGDFPMPPKVCV